MKCDFCSRANPQWRHPAKSFNDGIGGRSLDDWLACDECNALIFANDLDGLVRRALRENANPVIRAIATESAAIDYTRNLYRRFWRARRGVAHRIAA